MICDKRKQFLQRQETSLTNQFPAMIKKIKAQMKADEDRKNGEKGIKIKTAREIQEEEIKR